ncbi:MAG: ECF transporter S component [Clostridiales bacterium]|nr:ECF transporter S component [Clostridiales bacterium]
MDFGKLWTDAKDHVEFILVVIVIIAAILAIAIISEKLLFKGVQRKRLKTRNIAVVGMLSAIAVVLFLFEIPLPFAPSFYELDFSELPVLIGSFALGPVAGVTIELCKILLKLVIKGTTTAFVGDFANFIIGCSMIVPAAVIYHKFKSKKSAVVSLVTGTAVMTVFGSLFNAFYLLPAFAQLYGMPLDAIIEMGSAINSSINSVATLVLFAVVPFNILKGALLTILTMLLYKHISPIIKGH